MLMVILSWVGYRLIYKPGKFLRQLGRPVITAVAQHAIDGSDAEPSSASSPSCTHLGSQVPSSEDEVATLKADLIRAGFRSENALPVFYGVRIVVTLVMLVLCIMMEAKMPPNPVMKLGLMASGIGAGWILPRFFLEKKVAKRRKSCACPCPTRWTCWWSRSKPDWAWTRRSSTSPASCTPAIPN